jgi:hypothetical protein
MVMNGSWLHDLSDTTSQIDKTSSARKKDLHVVHEIRDESGAFEWGSGKRSEADR